MKKVLLLNFYSFINSSGGAERICCNMANTLLQNDYKVKIVCNDDIEGRPFYELDEHIELENIFLRNILVPTYRKAAREILKPFFKFGALNYYDNYKNIVRAKKIADIIHSYNPDIIICNDLESASCLDKINISAKTIFMLHGNGKDFCKLLLKYKHYRNVLEKFNVIQVLLPSYKDALQQLISSEIIVIPNPVPNYSDFIKLPNKNIVHVGRIAEEKGQLKLIEAFASINNEFPEWQILMYGKIYQTSYAKQITKTIENKNLSEKVFFMGETDDILQVWKNTEIFVLPSLSEGFPLALTEAMSAGIAVLGLKDCGGVNELIKDRINGVLSENTISGLANELRNLIRDDSFRKKIAEQAAKDMINYSDKYVNGKWEKLILGILKDKN